MINPSGNWVQGFQLPDVLLIKPLEPTTRLRAVHKPAAKSEQVPGAYLDTYRGSLVLHAQGADRVDTVNVLPIEDYIRGVVPAEMPLHWPAAALQAQAIAARGYAPHRAAAARLHMGHRRHAEPPGLPGRQPRDGGDERGCPTPRRDRW